ncbi:MAG: hypothetical protein VW270_10520 [Candidatus Poseidoniales archaeon]
MARTQLSQTQLDKLNQDSVQMIDLVRLEFPDGTIKRFTNADADAGSRIVDGSTQEQYLAGQGYIGHTGIPLTSQLNANRIELRFSAVATDSSATEPIARTLLNRPISGGTVHVIKKILDSSTTSLDLIGTDDQFIAFQGVMDNVSYKVTNEDASITLFCGGPFSNFDRTAIYGFTNTASQQKNFPDDTGFDFSANNVKNIRWEE